MVAKVTAAVLFLLCLSRLLVVLVFGLATVRLRAYTHRQDVLVLGTSALQPGSIVEIRALGYMVMGEWIQRPVCASRYTT